MTFLNPASIAGRVMIVLVVGLTLSHFASTLVLSGEGHGAMSGQVETVCAERVAVMARLLDHAPAETRAALAADLASASLTVAVTKTPSNLGQRNEGHLAEAMERAFAQVFGVVNVHALAVGHEHDDQGETMTVAYRLDDGMWANFRVALAPPPSFWSSHLLASTLVMLAGIVILGAWAVRWVAWPLATFASAAERLGRDVNAPKLAPGGPLEVRHAVTAFNEMQDRIRRFVDDRTRMLAAISHDLRSPITRLKLRTEMLAEGEARSRMLADLDEMEAMVSSALDFARGEAADEPSQAIDLAATLATICDNAADLGLSAHYAWEGRLICTCRPNALKRALANLIENGARYGNSVQVRTMREGSDILVVMEDEGAGIPEAELENVFRPFYRIEGSRNRRTGGIGLGLTVARTIFRAHGGDVRLENRVEGGLRVIVELPQAGEGAAA